jgi:excisionase family DNA binding protein
MKAQPLAPVPRVALTREEAAAAIGVSLPHFQRHVQPHLRLIRTGSCRLVPIAELERWATESASLAGTTNHDPRRSE